jgi:hypothetical protein
LSKNFSKWHFYLYLTLFFHFQLCHATSPSTQAHAAKRLRLNQNPTPAPKPMLLKVDTCDPLVSSGAYHPQTEAISPTGDDGKWWYSDDGE